MSDALLRLTPAEGARLIAHPIGRDGSAALRQKQGDEIASAPVLSRAPFYPVADAIRAGLHSADAGRRDPARREDSR